MRCDGLADVVAAVQSWSASTPRSTSASTSAVLVVAVVDGPAADRMVDWLETARRLVPGSRVVVHRSGFTPLGVEIALGRLARGGGADLASALAVEQLARLEGDMTTGVIRLGGSFGRSFGRAFGRALGRSAGPVVELAGPLPRRVPLDDARSLVPVTSAVLHFTRHRGAPASVLDQAFPFAWLDMAVEEQPGDLAEEACWDTPSIEFAFDSPDASTLDAIDRVQDVERRRAAA